MVQQQPILGLPCEPMGFDRLGIPPPVEVILAPSGPPRRFLESELQKRLWLAPAPMVVFMMPLRLLARMLPLLPQALKIEVCAPN